MFITLLFNILLGASFSSAQEQSLIEIPLNEIFEQLKISSEGRDKLLLQRMYPIDTFASSPDGKTIALGFHPAEVPKDSNLDNQRVLIRIEENKAVLQEILNPIANPEDDTRIADTAFVNNHLVRIETLKTTAQGFKRNYLFYDLTIKRHTSLLDALPFENIKQVRAISLDTYLVQHRENGAESLSVVWLDQAEAKMIRKINLDINKIYSFDLFIMNLDEENGLRVSNSGDIWIKHSYPHDDGWKTVMVKVEASGSVNYTTLNDQGSKLFISRIAGMPESIGASDKNIISVHSEHMTSNGESIETLVKKWTLPEGIEYEGEMTRLENGFIFKHSKYPRYGYIFLKDNGDSEQITDPTFRLRHSSIRNNLITGVSDKKPDQSVSYYIRRVQEDSPVQQAKGSIVPTVKSYQEIARFGRGRYRIVRYNENSVAVIDTTYIDDILRVLPLLDRVFKVITHQNTIEVVYPEVQAREAYKFPTFRKVINDAPKKTRGLDGNLDCTDALE